MDMTTKLIVAAERLFDRHGYMATGMDRLTEAAGMSSRTLYKHAGNKAQLMARVLMERNRRFMARFEVQTVDALFAALEDWVRVEGTRGCLFLRSRAETGGDTPEIAEAVAAHKAAFHRRIEQVVEANLGHEDPILAEQVLVLLEGATHAAVYRGADAVSAARAAASILIAKART
ncbi:TetR/AcrR family transcriptional regulator [Acidocella aminolytica]|jgi:AcrR family transcriptional regulator|uniref:Transcriptional regulator TetR n=1 Tax=Acidocella aminolytica 101 = DSM 11237 TaxID=1120923 RepID=A0A0D6PFU5_9PROT|nr:helix-turn-helix domain-containing protein [Acidocella aminolytica]GAN80093.1 transcriptional regulator TetR [Acidocella aminolytica 101 = DSM 11237]GBQ43553.1 transcriptional regulator [Acidocella aminolytica 101 = DSM 11237]SHE68456.1 transcriptional regulator, TetR family [Acidocella aminolytica 101 = DSM 11237]